MSLPTKYTELKYIESSGTQYIDLGKSAPDGFKFECQFYPTQTISTSSLVALIGSHNSTDPYGRNYLAISNSYIECGGGTNTQYTTKIQANKIFYTISYSNIYSDPYIELNGSSLGTLSVDSGNRSSNSLYLFYINVAETWFTTFYGRIYYANITFADNTSMALVPCIRKADGAIGMYDTVGKKFYGNAGSGEFIPGPRQQKLPDGYAQYEYIKGGDVQYINTEYRLASNNFKTELIFKSYDSTFVNSSLFGSESRAASAYYSMVPYGSDSLYYIGNSQGVAPLSSLSVTLNNKSKHMLTSYANNGTLTVWTDASSDKGTVSYSGDLDKTLYIYLCANNIQGTASQIAPMYVYGFKMWDDDVLVRDFIPCKNSDSVAGLYDVVEGKFYKSAGTSEFTAGTEITWTDWPSELGALYVAINGAWRQIEEITVNV